MAFKPNYRHERAERNRSKTAKAQQKLKEREEKTAQRKEVRSETTPGSEEASED